MRRLFFSASLFFICSTFCFAERLDSLQMYMPKIEGTIRTKYEYNTSLDKHRFQVRNARFSVNGNFSPIIFYKAEIDLSDEGTTKMLDAYIRMKPIKGLSITLGQQKIPFSTDNLRSPNKFYFANRSFIAKQVTGLRDVGATFKFSDDHVIPISLQLGVYNGEGLYNQQEWKNKMCYAARFEIFPVKEWEISLNYSTITPEYYAMHSFDIGTYLYKGGLHLETEFAYKKYEDDYFSATKAFFLFGAYDIPFKKWNFSKITPLVRYDMMTDNNKGYANDDGTYTADYVERSRITGGFTLSLDKPFLNDIRVNYEKYFYKDGVTNEDDKFVVELVVKF